MIETMWERLENRELFLGHFSLNSVVLYKISRSFLRGSRLLGRTSPFQQWPSRWSPPTILGGDLVSLAKTSSDFHWPVSLSSSCELRSFHSFKTCNSLEEYPSFTLLPGDDHWEAPFLIIRSCAFHGLSLFEILHHERSTNNNYL